MENAVSLSTTPDGQKLTLTPSTHLSLDLLPEHDRVLHGDADAWTGPAGYRRPGPEIEAWLLRLHQPLKNLKRQHQRGCDE